MLWLANIEVSLIGYNSHLRIFDQAADERGAQGNRLNVVLRNPDCQLPAESDIFASESPRKSFQCKIIDPPKGAILFNSWATEC